MARTRRGRGCGRRTELRLRCGGGGPRAVDDLGEDVAPELVLAERVARRGPPEGSVEVCGERVVGCDEGRCEGEIADAERGTNGFGYDVIFFREDLARTFGEVSPVEKNA